MIAATTIADREKVLAGIRDVSTGFKKDQGRCFLRPVNYDFSGSCIRQTNNEPMVSSAKYSLVLKKIYGRGGNFTMTVMLVYLYLGPVYMSPVSEISLYL